MPGWMKPALKEVLTLVHMITSVVWLMVEVLLMRCRLVMLPAPMPQCLPKNTGHHESYMIFDNG